MIEEFEKGEVVKYYTYGITLRIKRHGFEYSPTDEFAERDNNGTYVVYFEGHPKILQNYNVEFNCIKQLTKQEVLDKFEGTKAIEEVYGDFSDYKYTTREDVEEIIYDNVFCFKNNEITLRDSVVNILEIVDKYKNNVQEKI